MPDLNTKYLGLTLKNPIVIGSSGLTDSVDKIIELEKNGVGAVVLKSLFEEQILLEADHSLKKAQEDGMIYSDYSETLDYIDVHVKEKELGNYIQLIRDAKSKVSIPVIASINAVTDMEWTGFAKKIEDAGADAIELNIFIMPFNLENNCDANEKMYYSIVNKVKSVVSIPVSVKISPYFANLGKVITKLEGAGANGVVLFNRFSNPDIDIANERVTVADVYSIPTDIATSLRWIAIMAKHVKFDMAASTGIHDGASVIKQLLAGAKVTQVTSAVYKHGPEVIVSMLSFVNDWMEQKGYNYVDQFRGKLSQLEDTNNNVFERIQFMKYFSEYK